MIGVRLAKHLNSLGDLVIAIRRPLDIYWVRLYTMNRDQALPRNRWSIRPRSPNEDEGVPFVLTFPYRRTRAGQFLRGLGDPFVFSPHPAKSANINTESDSHFANGVTPIGFIRDP